MIPVYCVHYDKLTERKRYIESTQVRHCKFITGQYEHVEQYPLYNPNENLWHERCDNIYNGILEKPPHFRKLKIGDLACANKHLECLSLGWLSYNMFMVVEDDIIQHRDLFEPLDELISLRDNWDVAIIGGAFHHEVAKTKDLLSPNILVKNHPATNTVCAYVIKHNSAKMLLDAILKNKFVLPIDYEYNYWFKKLDFRVVHYVPYVFQEGSSAGYYKGTQER
jgi:GR25 family glycosyltransferase involved in LPS biosynthesis